MSTNRAIALLPVMAKWAEVLGSSNVVEDSASLRSSETATFPTIQKVPVILRPGNTEDIQAVVRIANEFGHALYPVSSGKNWGYGSGVPVKSNCAVLDLSRLNRITDFSERLGYVTVQPGVTQRDLFTFLQKQKSGLWMDATGSSPYCSLIGNAMERGFGHTPYGDHFAHVCNLEAVLPNGDLIRTGYGSLTGPKANRVYKWGRGPSLDGLFSQSNFGIVTEMTIWLMPAPKYFQAFFFQCDREEGIAEAVEALRPLRMDGTLRSAVHIGNDYKVLAGIQQFPSQEQKPLMPDRMKELRREMKFSRWSGSGGLYGTRNQVAEGRRLLRAALAGKTDKLQFLDDRTLALAVRFQGVYKLVSGLDLKRTLELVRPVFGLMKGIPTIEIMGSVYWRKQMEVPADPDPDRDRCGLLWIAPVAPMEGVHASRLAVLAESSLLQAGFEPQITFTLLTERSLACLISIGYDRDVAGEDQRAMNCYSSLRGKLEAEGYYSYRLGIADMDTHLDREGGQTGYGKLLQSIRDAVDPRGILAPGRYVPEVSISGKKP
jgi:4-cresol dehydrogenase (hydroxylating) flavoprotein subunit